ncbi:MAG: RNA methyltransferase [Bacteroidetes bacterium QH_2_63_10]|nr:MAG: RNA methyltransferase [Bacteroidetes bacterium QH_2_63_10]
MPEPLSNRRRKAIAALTRRRGRRRRDRTLVEGPRALRSALDANAPLVEVVVTPDALDDPDVPPLLNRLSGPVYETDADTMAHLTDVTTPQGLVAVVERRLHDADAVPERLGDAGTALPKAMRAAAGGHWALALARTDDLGALLDRLRRHGAALYGADLQGVRADAWRPTRPSALALGSEAHGLSAPVLDRLDTTVSLRGAPDRPAAESLNVAVAGGILLYEWLGS